MEYRSRSPSGRRLDRLTRAPKPEDKSGGFSKAANCGAKGGIFDRTAVFDGSWLYPTKNIFRPQVSHFWASDKWICPIYNLSI
jgi:hypothetical protein